MPDEHAPLIYVDLIKIEPQTRERYERRFDAVDDARFRAYLDRFQPYRWTAISGDNGAKLARSTERYFNKADAVHAIELLFGSNSNVYLRQVERANVELRLAA